jgi:outer membrane protein OmpA-like peptidoglycan-associated protein
MKKYHLIFFVFVLSIELCFAQSGYITTKDASPKLKEQFKTAYAEFNSGNYDKCIKLYDKILKKYPTFVNAILIKSECLIRQKKWNEAIGCLEKIAALAPEFDTGIFFTMGQIAMEQEQYVEARKYFEKYLTFPPQNELKDRKAKKLLEDSKFRPDALSKPVDFQPKNMGTNINSGFRDYFPSVTADENTLIYTVQIGEGQMGQEDLYRSLKKDGVWTKAEPLPNINTDENEAAQSISADGKFLVFTVCNRKDDYGSCDLYFSERVNGRWTTPVNIGAPINTANWESQPSVAPNGDAIYFARGGAKGQGDKNIMVSKKNDDGTWGEPVPVKELNTAYDDNSPCIHPDGQTLYFSSDGHPGMGGLDLFLSRKQADGSWSRPVNLGFPINTKQNEEALAVNLSGNLAFIASDRPGGYGSLDIYTFEMPEIIRPNPVTYVKGYVYDATRNFALANTEVEIYDLSGSKLYSKSKTDADGEFLLCLPMGKDYSLNVKKVKYLFYSDNFDLQDSRKMSDPFLLKIPLQPITEKSKDSTKIKETVNKPVILKNVFFSSNSADLRPESELELNKLKQLLEDNPDMRICINGHTDNEGDAASNLNLSDRRANAVRLFLITKGINANRLEARGFGESQPIDSNNTSIGRQNNRRTEFLVLK